LLLQLEKIIVWEPHHHQLEEQHSRQTTGIKLPLTVLVIDSQRYALIDKMKDQDSTAQASVGAFPGMIRSKEQVQVQGDDLFTATAR
jgi:hypothetical protein